MLTRVLRLPRTPFDGSAAVGNRQQIGVMAAIPFKGSSVCLGESCGLQQAWLPCRWITHGDASGVCLDQFCLDQIDACHNGPSVVGLAFRILSSALSSRLQAPCQGNSRGHALPGCPRGGREDIEGSPCCLGWSFLFREKNLFVLGSGTLIAGCLR